MGRDAVAFDRGHLAAGDRRGDASAGAPEDVLGSLPDFSGIPARTERDLPALPTRLFADGDYVDVPGWNVRAIWTPGHSPGHTLLLRRRPAAGRATT